MFFFVIGKENYDDVFICQNGVLDVYVIVRRGVSVCLGEMQKGIIGNNRVFFFVKCEGFFEKNLVDSWFNRCQFGVFKFVFLRFIDFELKDDRFSRCRFGVFKFVFLRFIEFKLKDGNLCKFISSQLVGGFIGDIIFF